MSEYNLEYVKKWPTVGYIGSIYTQMLVILYYAHVPNMNKFGLVMSD